MNIEQLVNRFLAWPLPDSVRCDDCASSPGYLHRSGTNLLTASEARQMLEYVLADDARVESAADRAALAQGEIPAHIASPPVGRFQALAEAVRKEYLREWRQGAHNNLGCTACGFEWDSPREERHTERCIVGMAKAALDGTPKRRDPDPLDVCAGCGWMRVHHDSRRNACPVADKNGMFACYHAVDTYVESGASGVAHPDGTP